MKRSVVLVGLLVVSACSSDGDGSPASTPGADAGGSPPVEGQVETRSLSIKLTEAAPTNLVQGKSRGVPFVLTRSTGVPGPVTVRATGLPAGITMLPAAVASGAVDGTLVLETSAAVPQGPAAFELEAQATDGTVAKVKVDAFVRGRPGVLDSTFNAEGIQPDVYGEVEGVASGLAVQDDGGILVGGQSGTNQMILHRVTKSGALDTTFGTTGRTTFEVGQGSMTIRAYGSGATRSVLVLRRGTASRLYRTDGEGKLTTSYGDQGLATITVAGQGQALVSDMAALDDGRALVAASFPGASGGAAAGVMRWSANGTLDTSYGINGVCWLPKSVITQAGSIFADATGFALVLSPTVGGRAAVVGCTNAGVRATNIGTAPDHISDLGQGVGSAIAAPGGGLVVLLPPSGGGSASVLVTDEAGKVVRGPHAVPMSGASGYALAAAPDGSVVVAWAYDTSELKLTRLTKAGAPDVDFGVQGTATFVLGGDNTFSLGALLRQPDGRLLVLGKSYATLRNVLARIWD